jgi:hypothetical protein
MKFRETSLYPQIIMVCFVEQVHSCNRRSNRFSRNATEPTEYLAQSFTTQRFIRKLFHHDGCQEMMNNDELIELVRLSGATHTRDSHFSRSQTGVTRVVLCEKEYLVHRREMYEKCIQAGVHFLTPEW